MTVEDIAERLNVSVSSARDLIVSQGWRQVGKKRSGRRGPLRATYDAADVEAYAKAKAEALRAEAEALDPGAKP